MSELRDAEKLADRNGTASRRPCLSCGKEFSSEGFHNRLCGECGKRASRLGEIPEHGVAPKRRGA